MARIFISYKRVDKDLVFSIKANIEKETGETCWIDLNGIGSDTQFVSVIMRAIKEAEVVLFMYSKQHANLTNLGQDWTVRELNFAQSKQKCIVFINLDKTLLTDWFEFMFPQQQQVDATSPKALEHLIEDIRRWLNIPEPKPLSNAQQSDPNSLPLEVTTVPKKESISEPKEEPKIAVKTAHPRFCNKCGNPLIPGQKFCNKCGNKIIINP